MKVTMIVLMCTALIGGVGIYVKTTPRPGKGALTTFKKDMVLHNYFDMDSTTESYIRLIKQMGLISSDGKSELVFQNDEFCIARDSLGYFPAIIRKNALMPGLRRVYLKPRDGVSDDLFYAIHENVNKQDGIKVVDSTSGFMEKNHYQAFEITYPNDQFPKTLRKGAGTGADEKSSYYVAIMQQALRLNGGITRTDGVFDYQTERAVKKFQHDHGLVPDGIVGNQTKMLLKIGEYRPKDSWLESISQEIRNMMTFI
jgi:hypothetical protein